MSFLTQLSWRYATKKFDSTKKLSEEQLHKIMEAIKMVPTSFGLQPFRVIVVTNSDTRVKLKDAAWGQSQVTDASHLLVFCADTNVAPRIDTYFEMASGGSSEVREKMKGYEDMMRGAVNAVPQENMLSWTSRQAYIALGFALAACAELEIDSCPMEGFDPQQFKTILELPEPINPVVILPVGFRGADDVVHPKVRFNDLFEHRD